MISKVLPLVERPEHRFVRGRVHQFQTLSNRVAELQEQGIVPPYPEEEIVVAEETDSTPAAADTRRPLRLQQLRIELLRRSPRSASSPTVSASIKPRVATAATTATA